MTMKAKVVASLDDGEGPLFMGERVAAWVRWTRGTDTRLWVILQGGRMIEINPSDREYS